VLKVDFLGYVTNICPFLNIVASHTSTIVTIMSNGLIAQSQNQYRPRILLKTFLAGYKTIREQLFFITVE